MHIDLLGQYILSWEVVQIMCKFHFLQLKKYVGNLELSSSATLLDKLTRNSLLIWTEVHRNERAFTRVILECYMFANIQAFAELACLLSLQASSWRLLSPVQEMDEVL